MTKCLSSVTRALLLGFMAARCYAAVLNNHLPRPTETVSPAIRMSAAPAPTTAPVNVELGKRDAGVYTTCVDSYSHQTQPPCGIFNLTCYLDPLILQCTGDDVVCAFSTAWYCEQGGDKSGNYGLEEDPVADPDSINGCSNTLELDPNVKAGGDLNSGSDSGPC